MTIADTASTPGAAAPRWLLLASLALNLFFIGVAGAVLVRHYVAAPPAAGTAADRSDAARIERLAATLPAADADILRSQFASRRAAVDSARNVYRGAQETIRAALRGEPFSADAMRAGMAQTRAARQSFDQVLQGVILAAAAEMSPAGRNKLADWPPGPRP